MSLATWSKNKLHKNWSYPIGLEILNNFLCDIPNSLEKSVQFCDGTSYWIHNSHSRFSREPDIILVSTHFALFRPKQIGWTIRINSVPSSYRALIKKSIIKDGLPRIQKWLLNQSVSEANIMTRPFCYYIFNNEKDGFKWLWKNISDVIQKVEKIPIEPKQ
jgi:hypothetical protein